MSSPLRLKKTKLEKDTVVGATEMSQNNDGDDGGSENNAADGGGGTNNREEQEEALVALIEHRVKEVEQLRKRVLYYNSQLDLAEKKLQDTEHKLVRLRRGNNGVSSGKPIQNGTKKVQVENQSGSAMGYNEGSFKSLPQSKRELLIPPVNHKITHPKKLDDYGAKAPMASCSHVTASNSKHSNNINRKIENVQKGQEDTKNEDKRRKRKLEEKEHIELIPSIRSSSSPSLIRCQVSNHISSQHKRKMRSLSLCPVNDNLFVTSALDGVVNLWQIQARGSNASLLSTTDCLSPKRRWPEDVAWHPQGDSLFFTYSADGDSQISVLDLNKKDERSRVTFLENKPHVKGIINNISFLPLETTCFVTGGSDHAVILWTEKDGENSWKPKALHRNLHTSAVMGVAGLQQKQIVISAGADKRILGYDLGAERTDFKHQIESKCMSVLPNPCDFNLFMVQTGTPERQLKLYDIRLRKTEVHEFGWKQESSESQSALINQAWSPDGLYITSGSADPVIHIFDIRYNARKPSQSVNAHQKRVFKALWHFSLPLLISISSDLNIGLHKIS